MLRTRGEEGASSVSKSIKFPSGTTGAPAVFVPFRPSLGLADRGWLVSRSLPRSMSRSLPVLVSLSCLALSSPF